MKPFSAGMLLLAIALLSMTACNKKTPQSSSQTMQQGPDVVAAHDVNAVAGIHWTRPERWGMGPARQMRIATYDIPAAQGDPEGGECAIFYFGSGQGGDISANVGRWAEQFENGQPEQSTKTVNGLNVTLVKIGGTYLSPGGPMMQSTGKKENYRLLGAIVEAPEGSVFFKLTGPSKTVDGCESEFEKLVDSISK